MGCKKQYTLQQLDAQFWKNRDGRELKVKASVLSYMVQNALRTSSIRYASQLDSSVTDIPSFELSELELPKSIEVNYPDRLRLGHLVEKVFSELVGASSNFRMLGENIQVVEGNNTIGELDFILEHIESKQVTHVELAYKFYLFDPDVSEDPIHCWIGPNRNDSLSEKLRKLKEKQFSVALWHSSLFAYSEYTWRCNIQRNLSSTLLTRFFICPYGYSKSFGESTQKAIKGYYLTFISFTALDTQQKSYYLPIKKNGY